MEEDRPRDAPEEHVERRTARGEARWPPAAAVLVALLVYGLLPDPLLPSGRWLFPAVELLLLVVLVATNPRRMTRETAWSRELSLVLSSVVIATTLVSLGLLIHTLGTATQSGQNLLLGAIQIWVTNVIGFALLYWELDRGGPVARREGARTEMAPADWQFPQDDNDDTVAEVRSGSSKLAGWVPVFVDYLYVSLTNSSAFSPTDTMPLTSRAKLLMALQGTAAMLTLLLVVARAVNSISG